MRLSRRRARAAFVVLLVVTTAACAGPAVSVPAPGEHAAPTGPGKDVWVVRHGWHTRVAVRLADVDPRVWPDSREFGPAAYIEVGWGDRDFYPKSDPSVWDAIDPIVRATPAALHVGVLDVPPHEFAGDDVVQLSVPAAGVERLARFVHAHYARDDAGRPVRIGAGYYPRSAFYRANGRYHALTYNSNNWTASALQAAGVSTHPASAVTSAAVMRQAADIAATQPRPRAAGR